MPSQSPTLLRLNYCIGLNGHSFMCYQFWRGFHKLSVQVNLDNGYTITDAKLLPFSAKAAQYHFHWGTATADSYTGGSEHTVDETRHFGEMHVVHYNTKYPNISAAIDQSDGLAVFGWFITVCTKRIHLLASYISSPKWVLIYLFCTYKLPNLWNSNVIVPTLDWPDSIIFIELPY